MLIALIALLALGQWVEKEERLHHSDLYAAGALALDEGRREVAIELLNAAATQNDRVVQERANRLLAEIQKQVRREESERFRELGEMFLGAGDGSQAEFYLRQALEPGDDRTENLWRQADALARKQDAMERARQQAYVNAQTSAAEARASAEQRQRMVRDIRVLMDRVPSGIMWVTGNVAQGVVVDAVTKPGSLARKAFRIYDALHLAHEVYALGRRNGCVSTENNREYIDLGCTLRAATR